MFRQTFIPLQAFLTNILKKRSVVINAENFKNVLATRNTVFPFILQEHGSYRDSICPFGC